MVPGSRGRESRWADDRVLPRPEVEIRELDARFTRFDGPATESAPTVMDYTSVSLPAAIHRFFDLKNGRGVAVEQRLDGIVEEARIVGSLLRRYREYDGRIPLPRVLRRYPFQMKSATWLTAINAFHWSTYIGDGRYLLSGFRPVVALIDLRERTFHNIRLRTDRPVLQSARVHWDDASRCVYFWQTDRRGLFESTFGEHGHTSPCHVGRLNIDTHAVEILWRGRMKGLVDDVRINPTGEYLVACNFAPGYRDLVETGRNLVLNLRTGDHGFTDEIVTPGHVDFDVEDPDVAYFSEHNFQMGDLGHLELGINLVKRMLNRPVLTGVVSPYGPARILKYRLAGDRAERIGATTHEKLSRMASHWNFRHRGRHLLCAASSNPACVCLFDAEDLSLCGTLAAPEPVMTIIPSADGEHLFALAAKTKNVYVLDTGTGDVLSRWNPGDRKFIHHMFHIGRVDGLEL